MREFYWLWSLLTVATLSACHATGEEARGVADVSAQRASAKLAGLTWRGQGRDLALANETIRSAVERALEQEPGLPGTISVEVNEGIVTLHGNVDNGVVAQRAAIVAQDIRGVRAVIGRLKIVAPLTDDVRLGQAVQRALLEDAALAQRSIAVEALRGHVLLRGAVGSYAERQIAEQAAWSVRGVVQVDSRLSLSVDELRDDAEIEDEVERRMALDPRLGSRRVDVDVDARKVALRGEVGSASEKRRARLLGWVPGVRLVDDGELAVEPSRADSLQRGYEPIPSDPALVSAVHDALRYDPRLPRHGIEVNAVRGQVTLRGSVRSSWLRQVAEQDARGTVGVWKVDNELEIRADIAPNDDMLARRVRERLGNHPSLTMDGIDVSARSGVVFLRGTADSQFEREQAERTTAEMSGVSAVQNDLTIGNAPQTVQRDAEMEAQLESALAADGRLDGAEISVSVRDGVVTLSGEVSEWDAYDAVLEHAYGMLPRRVVNELRRANREQRPSER